MENIKAVSINGKEISLPPDIWMLIFSFVSLESISYSICKEWLEFIQNNYLRIKQLEYFNLDKNAKHFIQTVLPGSSIKQQVLYLENLLSPSCDDYRHILQKTFLSLLKNDLEQFKYLLNTYFADEKNNKNFLLFFTRHEKHGFNFFHLANKLERQSFLDLLYDHFLDKQGKPCLQHLFPTDSTNIHEYDYVASWMVFCHQTQSVQDYFDGKTNVEFRKLFVPVFLTILYQQLDTLEILTAVFIKENVPLAIFLKQMLFYLNLESLKSFDCLAVANILQRKEMVQFLNQIIEKNSDNISASAAQRVQKGLQIDLTLEEFFWSTYLILHLYTELRVDGNNQKILNGIQEKLQQRDYYLQYIQCSSVTLYLFCYYDISLVTRNDDCKEAQHFRLLIQNYSTEQFNFLISTFNLPGTFISGLMQEAILNGNQKKALTTMQLLFFNNKDLTKEQKTIYFLRSIYLFLKQTFDDAQINTNNQLQQQCSYYPSVNYKEDNPIKLMKFSQLIKKLDQNPNSNSNLTITFEGVAKELEEAMQPFKSMSVKESIEPYIDSYIDWLANACGVAAEIDTQMQLTTRATK